MRWQRQIWLLPRSQSSSVYCSSNNWISDFTKKKKIIYLWLVFVFKSLYSFQNKYSSWVTRLDINVTLFLMVLPNQTFEFPKINLIWLSSDNNDFIIQFYRWWMVVFHKRTHSYTHISLFITSQYRFLTSINNHELHCSWVFCLIFLGNSKYSSHWNNSFDTNNKTSRQSIAISVLLYNRIV
jgi:hypothetical protein